MWLVAMLLLAQLPALLAQSKAALVVTPAQLRDAIRAGTEHIVIREHLDMSEEDVEPVFGRDGEPQTPALLVPTSATRSIRGNCTGQPWPQVELKAPVEGGRCVVLVRERLIYSASTPGQALWLSNLYVRSFPNFGARTVQALGWAGQGSRLWVSSLTFEGNKHRGGSIAISAGAKAYVSGATIIHNYEPFGVRALNATLALEEVSLSAHSDIFFQKENGPAPIEAGPGGVVALLQGVTIDADGMPDDVKAENGTVATDNPNAFVIAGPPPQGLESLPPGTILRGNENEVRAIQQVSAAAEASMDDPPPPGPLKATLATSSAGVVSVRTPQELHRALLMPARHIRLLEHIDFRGVIQPDW